MAKWSWHQPPTPGMIDVKVVDYGAPAGHLHVEFYAGAQSDEHYIIEVDERLVDQERQVMAVVVVADVGGGNCYVDLPGESFSFGDRAILPAGQVQPWSRRVKTR